MKKEIYCRIWTKEGYQDLTKEQWLDFDTTKLHRLDGPTIEWTTGTKAWYVNGKLHCLDGPAIEYTDGTKAWYVDDKLHRLDGPAVEDADGSKHWYLDGKWHRLDGPAVELAKGSKHWYVDGKYLPTDEVETWLEENKISLKTKEGQIALKLRWS